MKKKIKNETLNNVCTDKVSVQDTWHNKKNLQWHHEKCVIAVTPEELGGFNPSFFLPPPHKFSIFFKCILWCSFVCFELSFETFDSLELLIFPCVALTLVKVSYVLKQLWDQKSVRYFIPLSGKNDATALCVQRKSF